MPATYQPDEPPILIDGARVMEYAAIVPPSGPGRESVVVEGVSLDMQTACKLVVAEDFVKGGVFVLYCNADWETIAAGNYPDAASAKAAAGAAYSSVEVAWIPYRALTAIEQKEVETTRDFLREIAAEFPDG